MRETWRDLARDSLRAAGELRRNGRFRSSISRAYYAGFALITGELDKTGVTFTYGREGPQHAGLPRLVRMNLPRLDPKRRREIGRSLRVLYDARLGADYRPSLAFGDGEAREMVDHAALIFRWLGVQP